jgi:hypothetical protein
MVAYELNRASEYNHFNFWTKLTYFHELYFELYVMGDHLNFVLFNALQ